MRVNPAFPLGAEQNPVVYKLPGDFLYQPTYDWQVQVEFDAFWLVFPTFGPFTAGAQLSASVNVPNDADFECRRITYHIDDDTDEFLTATLPLPNITLLITDSGSGRNLMNVAAPLASIADNEAASPRDLAWPKIFTRNSTITAALTNYDGTQTTYNVRLTLAGRKIFSLS